jgi:hypothetical protein
VANPDLVGWSLSGKGNRYPSLVTMILTLNLFQAFPLQLSLTPWFLSASLMPLVLLAAMACGACTVAIGKRGGQIKHT